MNFISFTNLLFFFTLLLCLSCGKEEEELLPLPQPEPEPSFEIAPIQVDEIVLAYWQDKNHLQGIAFSENSIFVANSKQVLEYDLEDQEIIQELKCTDFPGDYCTHSHYGDIAYADQDLWIAFHTGGWLAEYSCAKNQLLKFREGKLDPAIAPEVYLLDYPGHIGAVEVIGDQVYVAGKDIAPDWSKELGCHEVLLIYQYDLQTLQDSATVACNMHSAAISMDGFGQDGIQVLSQRKEDHLLVAPYPCKKEDNINRVYEIDLSDGLFTTSIFQNQNWAYGIAVDAQQRLFYALDNRYKSKLTILEFEE